MMKKGERFKVTVDPPDRNFLDEIADHLSTLSGFVCEVVAEGEMVCVFSPRQIFPPPDHGEIKSQE